MSNDESRVKSSIKNAVWAVLSQVIILILGFVTRTIFIKYLGQSYLGINGLFSNILSMLALAELGIGSAMIYNYYEPIEKKDYERLAALVGYYKKIYNVIVIVVLVCGLAVLPFLDWFIKMDEEIPHLRLYYVIYLFNTLTSYLFVYRTDIIAANQKKYIVTRIGLLFKVIKNIGQLIVLCIFKNFALYIIIELICNLLCNYICNRLALKMYPYTAKKVKISSEDKKSIIVNMKSTAVYKLSEVLLNSTDNLFISKFVSTVAVGLYSNYCMIIIAISNTVNIVYSSVCASVGNLLMKKNDEKNYLILNVLRIFFLWIGTIVFVCLSLVFNDFIELWVGKDNVMSIGIVLIIVLNYYMPCINNAVWIYRDAGGLFKETKYITFCTAIINIVLSIILGKMYGIIGILGATLIAKTVTRFWFEPLVVYKKLMKVPVRKYYITQLLGMLLTGVCFGLSYVFTKKIIGSDVSWINIIIKSIMSFLITTFMFFIVFMKTKEFEYINDKFIRTLLRKLKIVK